MRRLPKGTFLILPQEILVGKLIRGIVIDKGEAWTMEGDEWKAKVDDPNEPKVKDEIVYSLCNFDGVDDVLINGKLHHLIRSYRYIM